MAFAIAEGVSAGCVMIRLTLLGSTVGKNLKELAKMSNSEIAILRDHATRMLKNVGTYHVIDTIRDLPELAKSERVLGRQPKKIVILYCAHRKSHCAAPEVCILLDSRHSQSADQRQQSPLSCRWCRLQRRAASRPKRLSYYGRKYVLCSNRVEAQEWPVSLVFA